MRLGFCIQECEFNPKKPVHCDQGCGLVIPKDELKNHNCVRELRALIQTQQTKMSDLQTETTELKLQTAELRREMQLLKVSYLMLGLFHSLLLILSLLPKGIHEGHAA